MSTRDTPVVHLLIRQICPRRSRWRRRVVIIEQRAWLHPFNCHSGFDDCNHFRFLVLHFILTSFHFELLRDRTALNSRARNCCCLLRVADNPAGSALRDRRGMPGWRAGTHPRAGCLFIREVGPAGFRRGRGMVVVRNLARLDAFNGHRGVHNRNDFRFSVFHSYHLLS